MSTQRGEYLRWGGLALVAVCVLIRAAASYEPLPYWSMDALQISQPLVGIGPAQSQILDVLTMLGAGMVLLGAALSGGLMLWPSLLGLIGAVGVVLHALVLWGWHIDHARVGATWIASVMAALAALHACRDARAARLLIAISIGATVLLVSRGLVQVFIEHPETVRQYRANREAFIAAQGWAPGSASVAVFERRLNQPEAVGWFGLSNVFASFAAAALVAYVGWSARGFVLRARREFPDGWAGVLAIGAVVALVGLHFSRSKGGMAAAGLGLVLTGIAAAMCWGRSPRVLRGLCRERVGGWVALLLVMVPLAAVLVRGLLGERVGELSLLFRWFYIEGATRIFAMRPLFGTGPDGFKNAYLLAKPALSPEEVQSPHSVLFDYAATLGIFGLAWCGLFGWVVMRVGWGLIAGAAREGGDNAGAPAPARELRIDAWACVLAPISVGAAGIYLESAAITPDQAVLRLVGMLLWAGVAIATIALMRIGRWWLVSASAAAMVLAVHAQIEVTPVWPSSAGLFWLVLGGIAGAAIGPRSAGEPRRGRRAGQVIIAAAVLLLALVWARAVLAPTARWQGELHAAAAAVEPVASFNERLNALRAGLAGDDTPARIAEDLSAATGVPIRQGERDFDAAMHALVIARAGEAVEHLSRASALAPSNTPTHEALARVHMAIAASAIALGRQDDRSAERAEDVVARHAGRHQTPGSLAVLANVQVARFELDRDRDHLYRAARTLEWADWLDPHGLQVPHRLARLYLRLREPELAARWAETALSRDALLRLDPLRRLSEAERLELERARLAAEPPS